MRKIVSTQLEEDFAKKLEDYAEKNYRNLSLQLRLMIEGYAKEHKIFEENE